ncbi:MAG: HepT-like ribonuclease domain-containing protein [Planctomycetota bacterium]
MKDDIVYLRHIEDCIRRIEEDTAGGRDAFLASHTLQDAVIRNLQTLAESTQRLSDAMKDANPEIEWYRIAAFRNVLVHDYLGVDIEKIWEITQRDVPALKSVVSKMLRNGA